MEGWYQPLGADRGTMRDTANMASNSQVHSLRGGHQDHTSLTYRPALTMAVRRSAACFWSRPPCRKITVRVSCTSLAMRALFPHTKMCTSGCNSSLLRSACSWQHEVLHINLLCLLPGIGHLEAAQRAAIYKASEILLVQEIFVPPPTPKEQPRFAWAPYVHRVAPRSCSGYGVGADSPAFHLEVGQVLRWGCGPRALMLQLVLPQLQEAAKRGDASACTRGDGTSAGGTRVCQLRRLLPRGHALTADGGDLCRSQCWQLLCITITQGVANDTRAHLLKALLMPSQAPLVNKRF